MLIRQISYTLFLLLVFFLNLFYDSAIAMYLLLSVIMMPVFSFIFTFPSKKKTKVSFVMPDKATAGENVRLEVRINGRKILPIGCVTFYVSSFNAMTGDSSKRQKYAVYGCKASLLSYPIRTDECGRIQCEISEMKVYDYLGLFRRTLKNRYDMFINVFPTAMPILPYPKLPYGKLLGVTLKPKRGGGFAEDYDIREYRNGDPINLIHWKLTVKRDEPVIREALIGEKAKALVTFDLFGNGREISNMLSRLIWILQWLIDQNIHPYVKWTVSDGMVKTKHICGRSDIVDLFIDLFVTPVSAEGKSVEDQLFDGFSWQYHVGRRDSNEN